MTRTVEVGAAEAVVAVDMVRVVYLQLRLQQRCGLEGAELECGMSRPDEAPTAKTRGRREDKLRAVDTLELTSWWVYERDYIQNKNGLPSREREKMEMEKKKEEEEKAEDH